MRDPNNQTADGLIEAMEKEGADEAERIARLRQRASDDGSVAAYNREKRECIPTRMGEKGDRAGERLLRFRLKNRIEAEGRSGENEWAKERETFVGAKRRGIGFCKR